METRPHPPDHRHDLDPARVARCAVALAAVVRAAAPMPHGSAERQALAAAASKLRRVV